MKNKMNKPKKNLNNSTKVNNESCKKELDYILLRSAIYSCNIEGNSIYFETYIKNKKEIGCDKI